MADTYKPVGVNAQYQLPPAVVAALSAQLAVSGLRVASDGVPYVETGGNEATAYIGSDGQLYWYGNPPAAGASISDPTRRLVTEKKAADTYVPESLISTFTLATRKKVLLHIPFLHAGYAAAQAVWGDNYPQAFVIDEAADELFVISPNYAATHQVISVFTWSTGAYKTVFGVASAFVSEGAVILREGASRFLYLRATNTDLSKYDITTLPAPTTLVAPTTVIPTGQGINFTYRNGVWTVSEPTPPIGLSESRGAFRRLDATFQNIGQWTFPESLAGGSTYKYRDNSIPKMQGIAEGPGYFVESVGGYHAAGAAVTPYGYNGVRVLSGQGVVMADSLLDPSRMITILAGAGITATRLENEGVQILGNRIISFNVTDMSATGGLLFMEEFSADPAAIDFGTAATVWTMPDVRITQTGMQPRAQAGGLFNPATNEALDTLAKIIDYMKSVGQSVFSWYTSSVTIKDINNVNFPTGYVARLFNGNNSTFYLTLIGANGLWYRITTSGTTLSQSFIVPGFGANVLPNGDGSLALGTATNRWSELYAKNGVVLNSPDGTKYRITVANGGALSTVVVP